MKDYYNKFHGVVYLGTVTGKEFEEKYMEMANSVDKLPTASTILRLTDSEGCTLRDVTPEAEPLVEAWIFYETNPNALKSIDKATGQVKVDMTEKEGREIDPDTIPDEDKEGELVV